MMLDVFEHGASPTYQELISVTRHALLAVPNEVRDAHLNGSPVLRWRMHPTRLDDLANDRDAPSNPAFPIHVYGARLHADSGMTIATAFLELAKVEKEVEWTEIARVDFETDAA